MHRAPQPANEPVLSYAAGTPEREAIRTELARQSALQVEIPLRIGGEAIQTADTRIFYCPHRHERALGRHAIANEDDVERAIEASCEARAHWACTEFSDRAAV